MLHSLLITWFEWLELWGYAGIFVLMAMESSIIPVPSEIVMPPAAFWAAQGRMSFAGVVLAGTAGSFFGSILNYWLSYRLGRPIINRYGKYFLMPPEKIASAEVWLHRFGTLGIFITRFLPVVRHLISIPAGLLKMPVVPFSIATTLGAGLWCWILAWFGAEVIGNSPELLQSPEAMIAVIKAKMHWFIFGTIAFALSYLVMITFKKKSAPKKLTASI